MISRKNVLIACMATLLSNTVHSETLSHAHGNVTHQHPLPNIGIGHLHTGGSHVGAPLHTAPSVSHSSAPVEVKPPNNNSATSAPSSSGQTVAEEAIAGIILGAIVGAIVKDKSKKKDCRDKRYDGYAGHADSYEQLSKAHNYGGFDNNGYGGLDNNGYGDLDNNPYLEHNKPHRYDC